MKILKNPKIVFPAVMALFMAFVMSFVMTAVNRGFSLMFVIYWLKSFVIGYICAFPTAAFFAPIARKITEKVCSK